MMFSAISLANVAEMMHTAAFDFDERVLETGVRYFEAVAGGTVS